MDKFEEKEMSRKRPFSKITCYDWYRWLISYIPKPVKNWWMVLKTKL